MKGIILFLLTENIVRRQPEDNTTATDGRSDGFDLFAAVFGGVVGLVDEAFQVHVATLELGVLQKRAQLLFEFGKCRPLRRVGRPTFADHPEEFGPAMRWFVQPIAFPHASHHLARAHRAVRRRTCEHTATIKHHQATTGSLKIVDIVVRSTRVGTFGPVRRKV